MSSGGYNRYNNKWKYIKRKRKPTDEENNSEQQESNKKKRKGTNRKNGTTKIFCMCAYYLKISFYYCFFVTF